MIKHTDPYSVSQIFTNEKGILYIIPKYQREYTWGAREWELLFNDIISNDNGYFLGSIICVDISSSSMGDTKLEVIDGQQRLTSLSILLATFYKLLEDKKDNLNEEQKNDLYNLKKRIVLHRDNQWLPRLTPQVQNNNKADYLGLLCDLKLLENYEKPQYAGLRKIYKAHSCFKKYIVQYLDEQKIALAENFNEINVLFELVDKISAAVIVSIEVETHKDAYMLFESLNNRGVPLSAIDLLKNMIISISDKDGKSDDCYETWKTILNYLGNDYSYQERFFRYYYDAYREELNDGFPVSGKQKYYLGYVATKSNLLDIYETLIKQNYQVFLEKVKDKASVFSIIINNKKDDPLYLELKDSLLNLERIQGAPSYILLLYLLSERTSLALSSEHLKDLIDYLTSYFVRRNITDYPNTRNLVKIFMDSIEIAKKNSGGAIIEKVKEFLKLNSSSDQDFESHLKGDVYSDNPEATRFLLCYYENKFKTNEIYTDLWTKDKNNKYIWTIEHIFPEGDKIPQSWVDMIADGDRALAKTLLIKYAHKFGNLTITGYNSNLSNKSFKEKKDRKNDKDLYIGYRNGLKLNDDVVNKEKWTVDIIDDRTNTLVNYFKNEFIL